MKEQAIKLLQKQSEKLNEKQFDLDAWKQQTSLLLIRVFGENDAKIQQIRNLESEYSSWSLRDASGNASYQQRVKKNAAAILEAAIMELEHFGLNSTTESNSKMSSTISDMIKDALTGNQVKTIRNILSSKSNTEEKQRQLQDVMDSLDKNQLLDILSEMLLNEPLSKLF